MVEVTQDDALTEGPRAHLQLVDAERDPDPRVLQDLQRTLYALDAILRLHFAQEEEIYHSLEPG